jgi:hypothetical protein
VWPLLAQAAAENHVELMTFLCHHPAAQRASLQRVADLGMLALQQDRAVAGELCKQLEVHPPWQLVAWLIV